MKIPARLAFVFPLLLALAVFWQVTHFEFVNYDDDIYIYRNPSIRQGLSLQGIRWAFCADLCFDSRNADYWQPVTMLSRMIDINLWGLNPRGHHLVNLALHLANVLLLYFIVLMLPGGDSWRAAWIAAAFAVHPAQADVVPWVTARKDVLSFFFGFWTVLAYLWYTKKTSWLRYLAILASYAFSLMSKPMLFTMPLLLLILDYWPLERGAGLLPRDAKRVWLQLVLEKWGLFFLSGISLGLTLFTRSQTVSDAVKAFYYREIPISVFKYLRDFIYPVGFSVHEPLPGIRPLWQTFAAGVFLLVLTFIFIRKMRNASFLRAGWFWFLVGLSPVMILRHESRFLPVPGIGLCMIIAWGFPWLCRRWKVSRIGQGICAVLLLCLWAVVSFIHVGHWRDSLSLGKYAVRARPESAQAHNTLGLALWKKGDADSAVDHLTKAIWLFPRYAMAHANLAVILSEEGKWEVAGNHFKRALELEPNAVESHNNYGVLLANEGNCTAAIEQYQQALNIYPEFVEARTNLGNCLFKIGKIDAGIREYQRALRQAPRDDMIHAGFGFILDQAGRYKEAIGHFAEAVKLNPANAQVHNSWAITLARRGKPEEAIFHFKEALRLDPGYGEAYNNLAGMVAAQGKWDEAAAYFQKALEINPNYETARRNLQTLAENKIKQKKTKENAGGKQGDFLTPVGGQVE